MTSSDIRPISEAIDSNEHPIPPWFAIFAEWNRSRYLIIDLDRSSVCWILGIQINLYEYFHWLIIYGDWNLIDAYTWIAASSLCEDETRTKNKPLQVLSREK